MNNSGQDPTAPHPAGDLVFEPDTADLSEATFDVKLSQAGMEPGSDRFFATIDRLLFASPLEIVSKVLSTQGFAINIENLIATFDHMRLGAILKGPTPAPGEKRLAKAMLPALVFRLPAKNRVGTILSLFYKEIGMYEAELAKVRTEVRDAESSKKEPSLRSELERLRAENLSLAARIEDLNQRLGEVARHKAAYQETLEAGQLMPPRILSGTVRGIHWNNRTLTLRSARSSHTVAMADLEVLPAVGTAWLGSLEENTASKLMFYGGPVTVPEAIVGRVTHASDRAFKIIDQRRKRHTISCRSRAELEHLQGIRRGNTVLLYYAGDRIMKFLPLAADLGPQLEARMRDEGAQLILAKERLIPSIENPVQRQKKGEAA